MTSLISQYLSTALWSSTDDDGTPLDSKYSTDDVDAETVLKAHTDVNLFIYKAGPLLDGLDLSDVMHDFWLTRNGHGTGFWDGDYEPAIGEALTDLAHSMGEVHLYVTDTGKVAS